MEMETGSTQALAKKLWSLIRVALSMARKGFAKTKLLLHLTLLLTKRTNKLASRALHSLLLSGAGTLPHPSNSSNVDVVVLSFITPNDYQFSRSPTPVNGPLRCRRDEAATMAAVQRVLELIDVGVTAESPAAGRCKNSPFPTKENEEETVGVNKAADEFIQRFYMDLRLQNCL